MSKLRAKLLTASETSASLPHIEVKTLHKDISAVIDHAKPKIILHLGSLPHAIACGRLIEKDSEILFAKHLSPTIEDWMSPERGRFRKEGIPNLYDAYLSYLKQENMQNVITLLNSDLSVIAELLMIKEIIPDMIIMDEHFNHIDPTIFTNPLMSLPLILQDFSSANIKAKGNHNLLFNSPYYDNILLQKHHVVASKSFEALIEVTGKKSAEKTIANPTPPEKAETPKKEIDNKQTNEEEERVKKEAEEKAAREAKRKKILEEKARVKAERRRRRAEANKVAEQKNNEEAASEKPQEQAAPVGQEQTTTVEKTQAAPPRARTRPVRNRTAAAGPQAAQQQQAQQQATQQAAQQQAAQQAAQQQAQQQAAQQQAAQQQAQQQAAQQAAQQQAAQQAAQQQAAQQAAQQQAAQQAAQQQAAQQQAAQQQAQQQAAQQQAAQQAVKSTAPLPSEGQQEEVVNSAKRALLQKRLRERLAK